MKNEELTGKIISAAINVHKALGPGFLESVYEEALALEFEALGIKHERQKIVPIFYRDRQVGEHRLDFLVEKLVVVELKAVIALDKIFSPPCAPISKQQTSTADCFSILRPCP